MMFNHKEHNKKYHQEHKEEISLRKKKYYQNNTEKLRMIGREKRLQNLRSWEGFILKKTNCQSCGRTIYFNNKNTNRAINFDHKNGEIPIKINPTAWLSNHRRIMKGGNLRNQEIWESCKFGMLCRYCNVTLPTRNRKQHLKNAVRYVFGKELMLGEKA